MVDSTLAAQANLTAAGCEQPIAEIAADKGYHSAANMELSDSPDLRTYIPERKSKRKCKCQQPCRCQTKSQRSSQKARRSTRCSALTYRDASTNPHLAKMVKKAEIGKGYPQACHPFERVKRHDKPFRIREDCADSLTTTCRLAQAS